NSPLPVGERGRGRGLSYQARLNWRCSLGTGALSLTLSPEGEGMHRRCRVISGWALAGVMGVRLCGWAVWVASPEWWEGRGAWAGGCGTGVMTPLSQLGRGAGGEGWGYQARLN